MNFIIPVENLEDNLGGVILYDPEKNEILKQYVHTKKWKRVGWRGGILYRNYLIATDWNEIHYFDIHRWKYIRSFSKKTFNDLHYLFIWKNNLYVVNTGIDAIEVFVNPVKPKLKKIHFIFNQNPIFQKREIDLNKSYNEMYKLKHSCHPNCILVTKYGNFVTCFEDHTRRLKSGNIIDIKTGNLIISGFNCHDGILYDGNYYLSSTRENSILVVRDFKEKIERDKFPLIINETIKIGKKGWWRGMVIYNNIMYLFASYGYGKTGSCQLAKVNLESKAIEIKRLPIKDGIKWNSVYQPNILR